MGVSATSDVKIRRAFEEHFRGREPPLPPPTRPRRCRGAVAREFVVAWRKIDDMPYE